MDRKKTALDKWIGILKAIFHEQNTNNMDIKFRHFNRTLDKILRLLEELKEESEGSSVQSCNNCDVISKDLADANKLVTALTEKCTELFNHIDERTKRDLGIEFLPKKQQSALQNVISKGIMIKNTYDQTFKRNEGDKEGMDTVRNDDKKSQSQEFQHHSQTEGNILKEDNNSVNMTLIIQNVEEIPILTKENYLNVVAQNPTVRLFELKSLMIAYSVEECEVLNKMLIEQGHFPNFCPTTPGWLEDTVIDFFIDRICRRRQNVVSISSALALCYFTMADSTILPCKTPAGTDILWEKVDLALFPININNGHWILVAVWPKKGQLSVLDSMSEEEINDSIIHDGIQKMGKSLNINFKNRIMKLSRQQNGWDCGVFVCAYSYFLIRGEEPDHLFDCNDFRKFITATIIDPDEPTSHIIPDNYYEGSSDDENRELDDMIWFEEIENVND